MDCSLKPEGVHGLEKFGVGNRIIGFIGEDGIYSTLGAKRRPILVIDPVFDLRG
jgi:hypothetical protein